MAGLLTDGEAQQLGIDPYYAAGSTRTKANSTLFVAGASFGGDAAAAPPKASRAALLEKLLTEQPGFVGCREVRGSCFLDFESVKYATSAMLRLQGRRLFPGHQGLAVDYDKDSGVARKRKAEKEASTQRQHQQASSGDYFCGACGTKALRTHGVLLSSLPCRSTDGASVVEEGSQLGELLLGGGAEPTLIRRERGIERQYQLNCRSCGLLLGYRSVRSHLRNGTPRACRGCACRGLRVKVRLSRAPATRRRGRRPSLARTSTYTLPLSSIDHLPRPSCRSASGSEGSQAIRLRYRHRKADCDEEVRRARARRLRPQSRQARLRGPGGGQNRGSSSCDEVLGCPRREARRDVTHLRVGACTEY